MRSTSVLLAISVLLASTGCQGSKDVKRAAASAASRGAATTSAPVPTAALPANNPFSSGIIVLDAGDSNTYELRALAADGSTLATAKFDVSDDWAGNELKTKPGEFATDGSPWDAPVGADIRRLFDRDFQRYAVQETYSSDGLHVGYVDIASNSVRTIAGGNAGGFSDVNHDARSPQFDRFNDAFTWSEEASGQTTVMSETEGGKPIALTPPHARSDCNDFTPLSMRERWVFAYPACSPELGGWIPNPDGSILLDTTDDETAATRAGVVKFDVSSQGNQRCYPKAWVDSRTFIGVQTDRLGPDTPVDAAPAMGDGTPDLSSNFCETTLSADASKAEIWRPNLLPKNARQNYDPAVSPDRRMLAFVSEGDIYVMDLASSGAPKKIAQGERILTWK